MEEVNHILLHTVVRRLVLRPSAKRAIAPIMFLEIQTSRYRVYQFFIPMDLNILQNWIEHGINRSCREHITFHVKEGGAISLPLLLD